MEKFKKKLKKFLTPNTSQPGGRENKRSTFDDVERDWQKLQRGFDHQHRPFQAHLHRPHEVSGAGDGRVV